MKLFQARSLSGPWRVAAAVLAVGCIIASYGAVAVQVQAATHVAPIVPALLAVVFGLVAVSGRAPL